MDKPPASLQTMAEHVLLEQFSPPAVLVNDKGDILFVSGRTGKYLELAAGKANWNLFAMAREGLAQELSIAFGRALRQKEPVRLHNLKVGANGGVQTVDITLRMIEVPQELRGMVMVAFTDVAAPPAAPEPGKKAHHGRNVHLAQAMQQLQQAREDLQTLREEMQTSQEELKSTNEELQSTNEELQSTNEELTTSKEEMQSMNEELQTINLEQGAKMEELAQANSDMKNLLNSTEIATVFLDNDLRVRRFTNQATKVVHLIPGDAGRPITDIASDLHYPELAADAREVLRTLIPSEKHAAAHDGRSFAVRITPYRTTENVIDGLAITFADVTAAARLEVSLRQMSELLKATLDGIGDAYFSLDNGLAVTYCNPAAERLLNRKSADLVAKALVDIIPEAKDAAIEKNCRLAMKEKHATSCSVQLKSASRDGRYAVLMHPQADGVAVLFRESKE